MTTVTVAHRLSTIMDSDQIAVINKGSISELGTHRELFEMNGVYATLCRDQGITADSVTGVNETPDTSITEISASVHKGDNEEEGLIKDEVPEDEKDATDRKSVV